MCAVNKFVDWNKEFRRPDAAQDYTEKLSDVPEMHRFRGPPVDTLTRNGIMDAIADINARGV
jgi:hypothetical protein